MTQPDTNNSVQMKCTCRSFASCNQIKVNEVILMVDSYLEYAQEILKPNPWAPNCSRQVTDHENQILLARSLLHIMMHNLT